MSGMTENKGQRWVGRKHTKKIPKNRKTKSDGNKG